MNKLMWTIEQQREYYGCRMIWFNLPYSYHDGYCFVGACFAKNEV